jgi:hypothetical protein
LNDIGWYTTSATILCLLLTGLFGKHFGQFQSYVGSGTFILGYELKKTHLQCIVTMAAAKMKMYNAAKHNG